MNTKNIKTTKQSLTLKSLDLEEEVIYGRIYFSGVHNQGDNDEEVKAEGYFKVKVESQIEKTRDGY